MKSSPEELKSVFTYDPETGVIKWAIQPNPRIDITQPAGYTKWNGYRQIKYKGFPYMGEVLAWVLYYGKYPERELDHRDGNPDNNRIGNLRDVSHFGNMRNMPCHRNGHILGTTKKGNRWQASATVQGKRKYIGLFATQEEAHKAYWSAQSEEGR
jgi:hypothetical protein